MTTSPVCPCLCHGRLSFIPNDFPRCCDVVVTLNDNQTVLLFQMKFRVAQVVRFQSVKPRGLLSIRPDKIRLFRDESALV